MALPIFQRTVTNDSGDVINGAEVTVVGELTGLDAVLFSDRAGATPLTNPFFTGPDGLAQFYATPSEYRVTVTGVSGAVTWRYNALVGENAFSETNPSLDCDIHDTLSGAISRTDIVEGSSIRITDRDDGIFDVVTGETANGFDVVAHNTLPVQLKLRISGRLVKTGEFGAIAGGVVDTTDAIRACCNYLNSIEGGTLEGAAGAVYLVSKSSVLTTSDITINMADSEIIFVNDLVYDGIGEDGGNGTSYGGVFYFDSGNDSTSTVDNRPTPTANILSNLNIHVKIRQTGSSLISVQACRGLRFRSCDNVDISGCYFNSIQGEDVNGWFFERNFRIYDNYFLNSATLSVSMMLQDSECYNNKFFNCDQPFELTATNVRVFSNTGRCATTGNFIKISDSSAGYEQDIEIFANKAYGSFNSFFANEIIISGDRFSRVHLHDNEINCEITSGRVYNLLTADGSWTFSDNISDKGLNNALGDCVFMRPATPESTINGNYTICGMKKIVGWASVGLSTLQDNMNQQKVAKISYFNNTYVIKDGVTTHPSQGEVAGSFASSLYRGSLFVDTTLVLNYVISNNIFDNGSETVIDRSTDVTCLLGSEATLIYRGASAKTMTRFYGKSGNILNIVVPLDAPAALTIQNNANIVNTVAANLILPPGSTAMYGFTDTGSKIFQI